MMILQNIRVDSRERKPIWNLYNKQVAYVRTGDARFLRTSRVTKLPRGTPSVSGIKYMSLKKFSIFQPIFSSVTRQAHGYYQMLIVNHRHQSIHISDS